MTSKLPEILQMKIGPIQAINDLTTNVIIQQKNDSTNSYPDD